MEIEKAKMTSMDVTQGNVEKIRALFPNAVTEVMDDNGIVKLAIDYDVLKQELSDSLISEKQERYQMTWPDKKKATLLANSKINGTLRPIKEKSINFDNTKNLYIEGDNLDVLKILRETYLGKIKIIYIDPPYNTGSDFIYEDDFSSSADDYLSNSGQFDNQGNRLISNTETNGRFHTDWLNMMYPRLKVARDLLSDDGAIFISIDDNETNNLAKLLDEIFGKENRLSTHHIQVRYGQKSLNEKKDFQELIENVYIYAKNKKAILDINKPFEEYSLDSFIYEIEELAEGEKILVGDREVTVFKKGEWKISEKKPAIGLLKETWISGSIYSGTGHGLMYQKVVEPRLEIDGYGSLYKIKGIGEDGLGYRYYSGPQKEGATKGKMFTGVPLTRVEEIKNGDSRKYKPILNFYDFSPDFGNIKHEGGVGFNSGKKPIKMLKQFINYFKDKNAIIMDFFSGSASTGHAVMSLNQEDGGSRQFIMVQLPENCENDPEAKQINAKTICDLGETRLSNAINQISKESNLLSANLDLGFRVLKLDSSNMTDIYYNPHDVTQNLLEATIDNVKSDRNGLDLLFQVMLECGALLSSKIEEKQINGKTIYCVSDNYIIACYDNDLDEETIKEIAKMQPIYASFKDSSFHNDAANINAEQIFKTYSPNTEKIKVI